MRVLFVNVVCGIRSTGRICTDLAMSFENEGHEVKIAYGRGPVPEEYQKYAVRIGTDVDIYVHGIKARLFDSCAFESKKATLKFIGWAEQYDPDLLWLHNIHGYYLNAEILFNWIKSRPNMQVKWTLHDCWAFTGHCTYFSLVKCEKWQDRCKHCPQKKSYPKSLFVDRSEKNYQLKKECFMGVNNMQLITPSSWLAELTRKSYLCEYPVEVVHNTIDNSVFRPTHSDFREVYGIEDKTIVLGIASVWEPRKGLNDIMQLASMLDDRFVMVLVGLNRAQLKMLPSIIDGLHKEHSDSSITIFRGVTDNSDSVLNYPSTSPLSDADQNDNIRVFPHGVVVPYGAKNIYKAMTGVDPISHSVPYKVICLSKTSNTEELAKLYTVADYLINPTYEDNYPTVNLEAIACGTKVITYNTGGSPETLL